MLTMIFIKLKNYNFIINNYKINDNAIKYLFALIIHTNKEYSNKECANLMLIYKLKMNMQIL